MGIFFYLLKQEEEDASKGKKALKFIPIVIFSIGLILVIALNFALEL